MTVSNVKINETYDLNFNKSLVIDQAFTKAFNILIYKIVEKKDRHKIKKATIDQIKSLVDNFSIVDEKFVNNEYQSEFEVQFNRKKIINYVENNNVVSSLPKILKTFILPILIDTESNELYYLNNNIISNNWNKESKRYFLIEYIFPDEDIEDYIIIKKNISNIENYNFKEIIGKYNLDNHIILIVLKTNDKLRIFSKMKFEKQNMLINKTYDKVNLKDSKIINNLIFEIKEEYEDKWKSINKLNASISLPITLALESKNTKLIKKFENTLMNMDLVSDFKIEKFNNKEIVYKIMFASSPNKFLDEMLLFDFYINTTNEVWNLK